MDSGRHQCQVLVIGSGPSGSVTASTLSARGKDVLLLEEGPNLPTNSCVQFSTDEIVPKYSVRWLESGPGQPDNSICGSADV